MSGNSLVSIFKEHGGALSENKYSDVFGITHGHYSPNLGYPAWNYKSPIDKREIWRGECGLISDVISASTTDDISTSNSASKINYTDYEQEIDRKTIRKFEEFKIIFSSDEYVDGEISKTQVFLEALYNENRLVFERVFKKAWLYVFLSPKSSSLSDFILTAATLEYSMLNESADIMLIGSWSHASLDVKDAVLRAAESWQNPKHSEYLEKMTDIDDLYISEYRGKVIESLRRLG